MKNIKLGEYKSFLNFVMDRVPELKDLFIYVNLGSEFSVTNIVDGYYIDVKKTLGTEEDQSTREYFKDKINQNIYYFQPYYREYFVFIHEIGHIMTMNLIDKKELQLNYKNLKSKKYNSYYEAFKENRNIVAEKLADDWAVEFTNKYFYEIVKYFTGRDEEITNNLIAMLCKY